MKKKINIFLKYLSKLSVDSFFDSFHRSFRFLLLQFFILAVILLSSSYVYISYLSRNLPSMEALQNYVPVQTTKLISADGKAIRDLYVEKREVIDIAEVPEDLRKALVFMEDRKFFDHPGIDIWGILRASSVIATGGSTQGASTLTQQLARNMYNITIGREQTLIRKLKEAITAYNIEKVYSKSDIMELYLNSVFFGHRANGIQAASLFYFGKEVKNLNLNESAAMVGLLPSPNTYSPKNKKRIDTVFGYSKDFIDSKINQSFSINSKDYLGYCFGEESLEEDEVCSSNLNKDLCDNENERQCNWVEDYSEFFLLTKIKGFTDNVSNIQLSEILLLDDKNNSINYSTKRYSTVPHYIDRNFKSIGPFIVTYNKEDRELLVYYSPSNHNLKYYRFRISGLRDMKWDQGVGGGVATENEFIESAHSWLSFSRKNLVLNVMNNQGYFESESKVNEYNQSLLLPALLSKNSKKNYGLASYFTEDVRKQLLKYKQEESYRKINHLLPYFNKDSVMFDLKSWVSKEYKMRLDIEGYKTDLYKDGLRVYCTLDTRIQRLASEVFEDVMKKNQKDLYKVYTSSANSGLLDSIITISKIRNRAEFRLKYQRKFSNSLEQEIINQERAKWRNFNKSKEEINNIIEAGKHIGEKFYDCGLDQLCKGDKGYKSPDFGEENGIWDIGEKFIDGNKQYNKGERFTDANNNGKYDAGEIFEDLKNGRYDADGNIVVKLRDRLNSMAGKSLDSLEYSKDYILGLLKNEEVIPDYLRKEFLIQGSLVVLDVETGNIIAMIGGRQEPEYVDFFNRSSRALRQPGSVFKPFVYMSALGDYNDQNQPFSSIYKIQNQPISIVDQYGKEDYRPENFDGKTGGEKTLREGLKGSVNLIAVRLIQSILREDCIDLNNNKCCEEAEPFYDANRNGVWDEGEDWTDCAIIRDDEGYEDCNIICEGEDAWDSTFGNGKWDDAEPFYDENQNGRLDSGEKMSGPNKVKYLAENFGIKSSIVPGEALALGSSAVYPLEITSAYSAIANNGTLMETNYIYKIENSLGKVLKSTYPKGIDTGVNQSRIHLIRDMMKDVINDGTGSSLRWKYKFYGPVAGKTGTTNKLKDAWFVGFTPQVCIGVWVGMDNQSVSIKKYGSQAALPIFAQTINKIYGFGEYSLGDNKVRKLDSKLDWSQPDGVINKKICNKSLKIASAYCKSKSGVSDEIFLDGYIPNNKCDIRSHTTRWKD